MFRNFRVMGATKLSETLDGVFLSNFKSDDGAVRKMLNDWQIFRKYTLVDIVELFDDWSRKVE